MTTYIALLRAVNVGGTGKLAMADLRRLCSAAGFGEVRTYIASGNVLFTSPLGAAQVGAELAERLRSYAGKPIGVFVRTAAALRRVLADNPYQDLEPRLTYAFFLAGAPPADTLAQVRGQTDEQIRLGRNEIYVHYPGGMGHSRLKVPAAAQGTARNLQTVTQLVALSEG